MVSFMAGERGAHQIVNRTNEPVRFLAVSNQQPDIVIRPDSGTSSSAVPRAEVSTSTSASTMRSSISRESRDDARRDRDAIVMHAVLCISPQRAESIQSPRLEDPHLNRRQKKRRFR